MASGPITSWQTDEEKVETVTDFVFLGSKITVDSDCSHEIKRHLLLGGKTMANKPRQCIKKQRHHFANKDLSSQNYSFSNSHVWSWTIKQAEHRRNDGFELWCWRRFLRVPWTVRSSNQKEISHEYSLEGLKLKLQ